MTEWASGRLPLGIGSSGPNPDGSNHLGWRTVVLIGMTVAISGSGPKGGTHADGNNYGSPPMFLACRTTERQAERRVLKTRSECEHGSEAIRASGPSRAVPKRRGPGCLRTWRALPGFPWHEPLKVRTLNAIKEADDKEYIFIHPYRWNFLQYLRKYLCIKIKSWF